MASGDASSLFDVSGVFPESPRVVGGMAWAETCFFDLVGLRPQKFRYFRAYRKAALG